METWEREQLNSTLDIAIHLLTRLDDRENQLTHAQKHWLAQAALVILNDIRSQQQREIWKANNPPTSDGIPF